MEANLSLVSRTKLEITATNGDKLKPYIVGKASVIYTSPGVSYRVYKCEVLKNIFSEFLAFNCVT